MFGLELVSHDVPTALIVGLLGCGLLFGAAYIGHARRIANPILDLSLLRIPTFGLSVAGGTLVRIAQGGQLFLLPLLFQLGFGLSAAATGTSAATGLYATSQQLSLSLGICVAATLLEAGGGVSVGTIAAVFIVIGITVFCATFTNRLLNSGVGMAASGEDKSPSRSPPPLSPPCARLRRIAPVDRHSAACQHGVQLRVAAAERAETIRR